MTNKDKVRAWFAAIDARDFAAIRGMMAANHSFANPMTPAPIGADEHVGMMQMMTGAFKGGHELVLVVEEDDHVAVRGRWTGTHVGEFNGVPPTGKPVSFTWIDIFEFKDGKVAREAMEMNPMTIMAQVGAMQAA